MAITPCLVAAYRRQVLLWQMGGHLYIVCRVVYDVLAESSQVPVYRSGILEAAMGGDEDDSKRESL